MGDMGIGHQHVVIADPRYAAALDTAAMDRNILANQVVVSDRQGGVLASVAEILGSRADIGERTNLVAGPDHRGTADHGMGLDHGIGTDPHAFTYYDIRTDAYRGIEFGAGIYNCSGVDSHNLNLCGFETFLNP
jgi:hypothetical protein